MEYVIYFSLIFFIDKAILIRASTIKEKKVEKNIKYEEKKVEKNIKYDDIPAINWQ